MLGTVLSMEITMVNKIHGPFFCEAYNIVREVNRKTSNKKSQTLQIVVSAIRKQTGMENNSEGKKGDSF